MKLKVYWEPISECQSFWTWLLYDCNFQTNLIYDGRKTGYIDNPKGMQWMASTRILGLNFDRYYKIAQEN